MNPRIKKLIGALIMLVFVVLYIFIIAGIAPRILMHANKVGELAFYIIAGVAWALPLFPLVKWMESKPK